MGTKGHGIEEEISLVVQSQPGKALNTLPPPTLPQQIHFSKKSRKQVCIATHRISFLYIKSFVNRCLFEMI